MTTYLTIIEDRHTDVDVYPFSTQEKAIEFAREYLDACDDVVEDEALAVGEWLFYATYSTEGDCVRVVKKELDAGG